MVAVGKRVVVLEDTVSRLVSQTGVLEEISGELFDPYPFFVVFDDIAKSGRHSDWVQEVAEIEPEPSAEATTTIVKGIDPQELADWLNAQTNTGPSMIGPGVAAEISKHFNLPLPTKKFVEVTLRIPRGTVYDFDTEHTTAVNHIRAHRDVLENMIHNVEFTEEGTDGENRTSGW